MDTRKGDQTQRSPDGEPPPKRGGKGARADSQQTAADPSDNIAASGTVYMLTAEAARGIDRLCAERYGLPGLVLMENAAVHLCDVVLGAVEPMADPLVVIFCGPGNNAGDGLALARHLDNASVRVVIVCASDPAQLRGDASVQHRIVKEMGIELRTASGDGAAVVASIVEENGPIDVAVDALLGTGLARSVDGVLKGLIEQINQLRKAAAVVVAVDIPSGLDATSGEPRGAAVQADITVTFVGLKPGLSTLAAQAYVGDVIVADIGAPRELVEKLGTPLSINSHEHDGDGDADGNNDTLTRRRGE